MAQSPSLTRSVPQKPLLPETLRVTESARSMPVQSPLLGPAFETQTPDSFYAYVTSLYRDTRARGVKRPGAGPSGPILKGRIVKTLTKKRLGTYAIQNTKTKALAELTFDKERRIPVREVPLAVERLGVTADVLRKFIAAKKYDLVDHDLTL